MLGGVRMMWPGSAPLTSGMPGSLPPGEAGIPMYFRARSSMPALAHILQQCCEDSLETHNLHKMHQSSCLALPHGCRKWARTRLCGASGVRRRCERCRLPSAGH